MTLFSELDLSPSVKANLARNGFTTPTPVQAEAIPAALSGRDIIATAQTGTGKTLAFALPIVEKLVAEKNANKNAKSGIPPVQAVILSPTRELAIQIHEVFTKLAAGTGLQAAIVVGGVSESTQLRALRNGCQLVIATPGRLCDFLDRRLVNLSKTAFLVLDEADRMLDMGFLPSIKVILQSIPAQRQTLFFSATMEKSVQHLVESHVKNPVRISIGSTTKPAENVDLHLYEIDQTQKVGLLQHLLRVDQGSFLVFVRTKHGADRLADRLQRSGIKAARIHGNRTQNQRNQALDLFKRGEYRVLVATDVAARGIHVDAIGNVVNFDLPQVPEDFIHRIGRTGRAGARGTAATFATRGERGDVRAIERTLGTKLSSKVVAVGDMAEEAMTVPLASKVVVIPANRGRHSSDDNSRQNTNTGRPSSSNRAYQDRSPAGSPRAQEPAKKGAGFYSKFARRRTAR
jgi:ATP-dependent RNA helicase RhlE